MYLIDKIKSTVYFRRFKKDFEMLQNVVMHGYQNCDYDISGLGSGLGDFQNLHIHEDKEANTYQMEAWKLCQDKWHHFFVSVEFFNQEVLYYHNGILINRRKIDC